MKYSRLLLITISFILSLGASEAEKAIEKRIAPVGSICVEGQDCAVAAAPAVQVASTASLPKIELSVTVNVPLPVPEILPETLTISP